MKILVDEHIPEAAVVSLRNQNHQVKRVKKGNPDTNILAQAKAGGRTLVTFDTGFRNLAKDNGIPQNGIILFTNVEGTMPDTLAKFVVDKVKQNHTLGRNLVEISCKNQTTKPKTTASTRTVEDQIAEAIIKEIPIGRFKSTRCRPIISKRFSNHKMAKMTDAEFGTEFLTSIWPHLKKRGVTIAQRSPTRYEITKVAKNR